jgi:LacI family transcriptional regulator
MTLARRGKIKTPTLAEVAAAVDLSPAAASLALNGKPGVSDANRERILAASRTLGYRRQTESRQRGHLPATVTLVIRALPDTQPATNVFYGPILSGIEERCRGLHIRLMFAIMPVDEHNHPLEIPSSVTDHRTDGLILVGADFGPRSASLLGGGRLPTVLVDGYAQDEVLDSVDIDNVFGSLAAVRYLINRGHREIAIVGTAPDAFPGIHERAAAAAVQYVQANPEVTAIFCANDLVAITFIQAARMAGISTPDQVSVMGFDDIDLASIIAPPLTTMAVDKPGMGRLAVTLLLHQLEVGKECRTTTLVKPTLVERATVRTIDRSTSPA